MSICTNVELKIRDCTNHEAEFEVATLGEEEAPSRINYTAPRACNPEREEDVIISTCCAGLRFRTVLPAVITASIMSVLGGTVLTYSSPTLLELRELPDPDLRFNTQLSEIFGVAAVVGSIFGGPLGGIIADRWGRKTSLATNIVPYLLGYFIVLSTYLLEESVNFKVVIITGRCLTGIGLGWSFTIVPIYIGEIMVPRYRGMFISIADIFISIGFLLSYGLGSIPEFHYYDIALVFIAIMAGFMFLVVWIPESPRWLLLRIKDHQRAKAVLKYLKGPKNQQRIAKELEEIKSSISDKKQNVWQVLSLIFCQKDILFPFLVSLFVCGFHQLCGVGIITNYVGIILKEAGTPNPNLISFYAAGLGFLFGRVLALLLVDVVGRKILLCVSAAGMCTGQIMLGLQFYLMRPPHANATDMIEPTEVGDFHLYPISIAGVLLFSLSFGSGVGPVTWIILTEYLPLQVRGIAFGICVALNRIIASILTGRFFSYSEWTSTWTAWWTGSFFNLVGFVVILLCVVETKGKTLEEVPELFRKRLCRIFIKSRSNQNIS